MPDCCTYNKQLHRQLDHLLLRCKRHVVIRNVNLEPQRLHFFSSVLNRLAIFHPYRQHCLQRSSHKDLSCRPAALDRLQSPGDGTCQRKERARGKDQRLEGVHGKDQNSLVQSLVDTLLTVCLSLKRVGAESTWLAAAGNRQGINSQV